MDHNFGTAQENPYNFFEVPAAQQHWNTNLVSVMRDDAAVETQKNGLRVIRDHLQDPANGHIWSPYVGVKEDNWGHDYADMQLAYNIAVCEMYSITGDRHLPEKCGSRPRLRWPMRCNAITIRSAGQ